jgi:NAD(P)-dependent dehydrogenase (short-subunit alcohol dehydrogenase family)
MERAMAQFTDKIALVTGAASGIGRATALAFAREGARVAVVDVTPDGGEETVGRIRAAGGGAIVNTASVLGLVASAGSVPYAAAKHGIVGLTKAAALEFARSNIRVNAVCPSAVETPMSDRTFANNPQALARFLETQPNGRKATPEEVAEAVLWLCSDAASYLTGVPLPIDGGFVAM